MIDRRRLIRTATVGTAGTLIAYGCQAPDPADRDQPNRSEDAGSDRDRDGGRRDTDAAADPDLPLLAELITAESDLVGIYRLALDKVDQLPGWCRDQLADHERHLRALRDLEAAAQGASDAEPPATQSPTDTPTATTTPPSNLGQALRELRKQEQRSVDARDQRLARAHGGRLARVIASMAASDQLHADRLAEEVG